MVRNLVRLLDSKYVIVKGKLDVKLDVGYDAWIIVLIDNVCMHGSYAMDVMYVWWCVCIWIIFELCLLWVIIMN